MHYVCFYIFSVEILSYLFHYIILIFYESSQSPPYIGYSYFVSGENALMCMKKFLFLSEVDSGTVGHLNSDG